MTPLSYLEPKKVINRTLILFGLGLLLNAMPFFEFQGEHLAAKSFDDLRIMGVLQRIAICYFAAAILVRYASIKMSVLISVAILLLYWLLCAGGNPFASIEVYSQNNYIGTVWDINIFGESHLYKDDGVTFDPEGIASTFPAMVNVFLGYLVFVGFNSIKQSKKKLIIALCGSTLIAIFCSEVWDKVFPMNKKMWTSSYVVYTSALATCFFIVSYFLFDMEGLGVPALFKRALNNVGTFFKVLGLNAIFIYVLNGVLVQMLWLVRWRSQGEWVTPLEYFYKDMLVPFCGDEKLASLGSALILLGLMWSAAFFMYKKKIIVKV